MLDLAATLQIAQVVAYLVGAVVFIVMIKADIRVVKHDMNNMRVRQDGLTEAFSQLTTILTKVAVQDNRINSVEEDIRELKHGRGFILDDNGLSIRKS